MASVDSLKSKIVLRKAHFTAKSNGYSKRKLAAIVAHKISESIYAFKRTHDKRGNTLTTIIASATLLQNFKKLK